VNVSNGSGRRAVSKATPFAKDWAGWYLTLYPTAREASGIFQGSNRRETGRRGEPGSAVDEERSRKMAGSRARVTLRVIAQRTV
jgi:hypothetical protein